MASRIKDSERMALIANYIKTKTEPDGYHIMEGKDGKYRVRKIKSKIDMLQEKRARLQKQLDSIDSEIEKSKIVSTKSDDSEADSSKACDIDNNDIEESDEIISRLEHELK